MAAITTTPTNTFGIAQPGCRALLQSEWTKLRSLRSTWIMVVLAIGLSIGFSALVALVTGMTYDSWSAEVQAEFDDPVLTSQSGWLFGMVIVILLAVTSVSSEYGSRMVRTSFIVTPNRLRLFAARAILVGMLGTALTAIAVLGMFLVSQSIYSAYGLASASVFDRDAMRFLVVGSLAQGLLYTMIPMSIGWILRGTASAMAVSLAQAFLPWMLAPILPLWFQENVLRFLPVNAKDSLVGFLPDGDALYTPDGTALTTVIVWIVGVLAAAAFTLNRRDV